MIGIEPLTDAANTPANAEARKLRRASAAGLLRSCAVGNIPAMQDLGSQLPAHSVGGRERHCPRGTMPPADETLRGGTALARLLLALAACACTTAAGLAAEAAKPRPQRKLGIADVVRMALTRNLRLAAEKLNPERAETVVTEERAAFDPTAYASLDFTVLKQQRREVGDLTERHTRSASAGIIKLFEIGTSLDAHVGAGYDRSNLPNALVNPVHDELAGVSVTQPLLKGFGIRVNTARIATSKNEQRIALAQLRQLALRTVGDAKKGYWELVYARRNREIVERSLERARKLMDLVNARVEAKDLGPQDPSVGQAKAGIAVRQEQLVVADDTIRGVEDFLKVITELAAEPGAWNAALMPTTQPATTARVEDPARAIETALARRPDYEAARVAINSSEIAIHVARNELLPKLDLKASLSYMGIGESWSRASSEFGTFTHYEWNAGLMFEYPLGNRAARARYRRATLDRQQARLQLRALERQVQLEVRNAIRAVATSMERLRAAEASVAAEQERVRAEEIRFREARLGTSQDVIFALDSLDEALRRRLRALIDLNSAMVDLELVKGTLLDSSNVIFVSQ